MKTFELVIQINVTRLAVTKKNTLRNEPLLPDQTEEFGHTTFHFER